MLAAFWAVTPVEVTQGFVVVDYALLRRTTLCVSCDASLTNSEPLLVDSEICCVYCGDAAAQNRIVSCVDVPKGLGLVLRRY